MALNRGKLSNIVVVSAGSTVGIITVASSKKVYIKSIMAHASTATSATAQVYFIPNGGSATQSTRIFDGVLNDDRTRGRPSWPSRPGLQIIKIFNSGFNNNGRKRARPWACPGRGPGPGLARLARASNH